MVPDAQEITSTLLLEMLTRVLLVDQSCAGACLSPYRSRKLGLPGAGQGSAIGPGSVQAQGSGEVGESFPAALSSSEKLDSLWYFK